MLSKQIINKETNMSFQESSANITINEGCLEYVLYIPSMWRTNCNITLQLGDFLMQHEEEFRLRTKEAGINIEDCNINPLPFVRDLLPEKYNKVIDICKTGVPDGWYFMGCSDTGIMSWFRCPSAAWSIEQYLEGVLSGSKLVKIVFTAALGEKDTPVCLPYWCFNGKYQKLKFTPCVTLANNDGTIKPISIIDCDEQWHSFKSQKNYSRKSSYKRESQ